MSMYYYLCCEDHRKKCAASSGPNRRLSGDEQLGDFVFEHRQCVLRVCTDDVDDALYDICDDIRILTQHVLSPTAE